MISSYGLDCQVARLTDSDTSNGHAVAEMVWEVGSGLTRKRPTLSVGPLCLGGGRGAP